ncbi:MFS-type efflux pump MSMEG_3705-like [Amphibalanus amphitrite]|uniref:MFS-type efflux pump MSMEG_3705-like n=1 Tax=Amphibalanus amphitrite TaxID=1232801 RepID=UPI001C922080|nr:MFS-type efflux pump MSMEG_3705-like [Amphibalanus amphitrite]
MVAPEKVRKIKKLMAAEHPLHGCWQLLTTQKPYSLYLLAILLATYLLSQINQYVMAVVARPMAQEIKFGERSCFVNETICNGASCAANASHPAFPISVGNESLAQVMEEMNNITLLSSTRSNSNSSSSGADCERWEYRPAGYQYTVLIGPAFFLFFTATGIPLGILADVYSRKAILGVCLLLWSACTTCTGFVTGYWQLLLLRIGVAVGESVCVPLCTSLIADHFSQRTRGAALGVFSLGTNAGYSLAFTLGDLITRANFYQMGWRWAFILTGLPGILHSFIISFTVTEPPKVAKKRQFSSKAFTRHRLGTNVKRVLQPFASVGLIALTAAAAVRTTVGIMWAYNVQLYFEAAGESSADIAQWLSWIPLAAGSLGAVLGGVLSDVLYVRRGLAGRVLVLVVSQLATAPCAAAALYLRPPQAYYLLIPVYILGEMFISVTASVVVELVPEDLRSSTVAVFTFITTNVGGSLQLLLGPIVSAFRASGASYEHAFRMGLYLLFPGGFALCGLLFAVAALCVPRRQPTVTPRDALRQYQKNSTDTLYGEEPPVVVPSVAYGDRPVAGLHSEA